MEEDEDADEDADEGEGAISAPHHSVRLSCVQGLGEGEGKGYKLDRAFQVLEKTRFASLSERILQVFKR